eukprot:symbB.v1.2.007746.t1/scaffold480.1/size253386/8
MAPNTRPRSRQRQCFLTLRGLRGVSRGRFFLGSTECKETLRRWIRSALEKFAMATCDGLCRVAIDRQPPYSICIPSGALQPGDRDWEVNEEKPSETPAFGWVDQVLMQVFAPPPPPPAREVLRQWKRLNAKLSACVALRSIHELKDCVDAVASLGLAFAEVTSVALDPFGSGFEVATGSHDGTLRIFDLRNCNCVQEIPLHAASGQGDAIHCVCHGGDFVVTAGADATVNLLAKIGIPSSQ